MSTGNPAASPVAAPAAITGMVQLGALLIQLPQADYRTSAAEISTTDHRICLA